VEIIFVYIWLITGSVHEIKTTLSCKEAEHKLMQTTEEKNLLYKGTAVILYFCSKERSDFFSDKKA